MISTSLVFRALALVCALGGAISSMSCASGSQYMLYVGTYTDGESKGIYRFRFDGDTGELTPAGVSEGMLNPSFLALHPSGDYLYAVNEIGDYGGENSGSVSAYEISPKNGELRYINEASTHGGAPCHIVIDAEGSTALVANYSGGNVASFRIGGDGRLSEAVTVAHHEGSGTNPNRQKAPHAHSINFDAANRYAFAADLGIDKVVVYRFNSFDGTLEERKALSASLNPGSGPRHFAFHPGGRSAYVINELSNTITSFAYTPETGTLSRLATISTLPDDFTGRSNTADVHVHPSGLFVYGSNRGHDSIAVYTVNSDGTLDLVEIEPCGGKSPRNFGIAPGGKFLLVAHQGSNTISVFEIDRRTGELSPTGRTTRCPKPVCLQFLSWPR